TRVRVDGLTTDIADHQKSGKKLARYEQHTIDVIVDRLVRKDGITRRLTDSMETALRLANGVATVEVMGKGDAVAEVLNFSQQLVCPKCSTSYEELAPRNFSFNTPYGACDKCLGLGTTFEVDSELVVPDPDLSISEGAIAPWRSAHTMYFTRMLEAVAEEEGIDTDKPWAKLTAKQ
ncbi:MAG: excinuclease ABC subunit UvrA, partial [Actinomycetota bacterium]